ncbi:SDR family NAD(P)-dependent oxidoreductase [Gilvimarinus sp. F26214L]|uniref:SDR family NAD(P)-dependent oxidoreductase n=1 Tax=Gilvimarinus sp. DZF01 TaxID=3461371 RepID=UPI0040456B1B
MSDLKDKNVVVAGGTSGIGFAIADLASRAGARVWALGRTQKYIDQANQQAGGRIEFRQIDIHDGDALAQLLNEVGTVHHLVGSATGANRTIAPFMQQTHEQFSEAFGKFWGYTNLVRTGVPFMAENGSITLLSGTPSRKCRPGMSSISCVGNAVEGLCRAIAPEIAPIRINTVAPGIIDTTMYEWMADAKDERLHAMTAEQSIKRPGKPEEVAGAVVYLMTADYVTGTNIDVDGGLLLP